MTSSTLWPYQRPEGHEGVSAIIRRHSANSVDVREAALRGLDLSFAKHVLDLGCGFGFMAQAVAQRVATDATMLGIDAWPSNETAFVKKVTAAGRQAGFRCMQLNSTLPWPDGSFDLIVCSYSLYFFVGVLPEVARVLAPHGVFVALTHSEARGVGDLPAAGFAEAAAGLLSITRRFSAENGQSFLERWFRSVTQIDYYNSLRFMPEDKDDLLAFLKFKLPVLVPGAKPGDDLPASLVRFAEAALSRNGEVVVDKNDAAFQCRSPRCH